MDKRLIVIVIGISVLIGAIFLISGYDVNILPIFNRGECDKLLYRDVQYALCYENDKIVVTTQHVNIYKATKTQNWRYDKIEVFDKPGGKIIKTYKGELYFGLKAECK